MRALLIRFWANQSGATAIEYGLIAALIGILCLIAIATLGASVQGMFGHVKDRATNAMDNANI